MYIKMTSKHLIYKFIIALLVGICLGCFLFFWNNISPKNTVFQQDILLKNLSWNTPIWESIPYKKWEEVEINFIFPWEWKNKLTLDFTKWNKNISIKKILIDETPTDKNDIIVEDGQTVKIIGEALNDWTLKKEDYEDIIIENEKIEEEKKEEINTSFSGSLHLSFHQTHFNSNINNLVEISWDQIDLIKYINIWEVSLTPIKNNQKTYLAIEKNTFWAWEYFIIIQLKNNDLIPLEQKLQFDYSNSKVNIANITPKNIQNSKDTFIVLQWNGFSKVISIQLSNNIILKNTSFDIINDSVLSVKIPAWLETGKYYFNIMTIDWISELKNNTFTINN